LSAKIKPGRPCPDDQIQQMGDPLCHALARTAVLPSTPENGTCNRRAGPLPAQGLLPTGLEVSLLPANFGEFSAGSDAKAVFGSVVRVAVIVAPLGSLLIVHMANDRHRDQTDGYADD
jgi:hypothetical protein